MQLSFSIFLFILVLLFSLFLFAIYEGLTTDEEEITDQEEVQLLRWNSLSSTEKHTAYIFTIYHLLIFSFAVIPFANVVVC